MKYLTLLKQKTNIFLLDRFNEQVKAINEFLTDRKANKKPENLVIKKTC